MRPSYSLGNGSYRFLSDREAPDPAAGLNPTVVEAYTK